MDVTSVYSFSELMIYIAISGIIFGVGSAISAANKGRSIFLWFLIGFLIGPFGFILSLVVAKNTKAIEEKAINSGEMRKCPFCAEIVKSEAKICKHCSKELPEISFDLASQKIQVKSIHDAVYEGNWSLVNQLLKEGVDVNQINPEGKTPLEIARERGDNLIIKLLISNGAK